MDWPKASKSLETFNGGRAFMIQQLKKFFIAAVAIATVSSAAQAQKFEAGAKAGFSSGYSLFAWLEMTYPIQSDLVIISNLTLGFADGNAYSDGTPVTNDNPKINFFTEAKYSMQLGGAGGFFFGLDLAARLMADANSNTARSFDFSARIRPAFNLNAYYAFSSEMTLNSGFGGGVAVGILSAGKTNFGLEYSYLYQYNQFAYDLSKYVKGLGVGASVNFGFPFISLFQGGAFSVSASASVAAIYQVIPAGSLRLNMGYSFTPVGGGNGGSSEEERGPSRFSVSLGFIYKF
jgi:hypothetical protein